MPSCSGWRSDLLIAAFTKNSKRVGLTANDHSHKLRMNVRSFCGTALWKTTPSSTPGRSRPLEGQALSRAERRDQQTQRILEAATACFVRSGFQGASMQQICAEGGMSPGALYRYFPSKEAIVEAICEADRAGRHDLLRRRCVMRHLPSTGWSQARWRISRHTHEKGSAAAVCRDALRIHAQRDDPRAPSTGTRSEVAAMIAAYLGGADRAWRDRPAGRAADPDGRRSCRSAKAWRSTTCRRGACRSTSWKSLLRAMIDGMLRPTKPSVRPRRPDRKPIPPFIR